jgi:secondary thiamine-phosphate synthase enzyme
MFEKINVTTRERNELLDITHLVQECARKSGVTSGICVIYTPHTTAGIVINENADPDVKADITRFLAKLIPKDKAFRHSEGNSDSHIKSAVCGNSKTVFVEEGGLRLGMWEGICFTEFDGPRKREVWVKFIKD